MVDQRESSYPQEGVDRGPSQRNAHAEVHEHQVIHKTFQPLIGPHKELPKDLAPKLLHRFSSSEGYALAPGVIPLLRKLKAQQASNPSSAGQVSCIITGVITNSDDRVTSVLSSCGLRVSPVRAGVQFNVSGAVSLEKAEYDIDLHCISYDIGVTKPDRRIFDAAEEVANTLRAMRCQDPTAAEGDAGPWVKVYAGDELVKDVQGAWAAGWNSVLVGPASDTDSREDCTKLVDCRTLLSGEIFRRKGTALMLKAEGLQDFLEWLTEQCA